MTISQYLQRDRFGRGLNFVGGHSGLVPQTGAQRSNVQALQGAYDDLMWLGGEQNSAKDAGKSGTVLLSNLLAAIKADLTDLSQIAQAVDDEHPELHSLFRLPSENRDGVWIDAAKAALINLPPHLALFVEYGLEANFLVDLQADLTAYQTRDAARDSAHGDHREDTAAIANAVARGVKALQKLDTFLNITLRGNPDLLAAWQQAARLGDPRRAHRQPAATP